MLLVRFGSKDEVFGDDGKFVEHEEVRWRCGGDVNDVQVWRRVGERVEVFLGCGSWCFEFWKGLLSKGRAIAKLKLEVVLGGKS